MRTHSLASLASLASFSLFAGACLGTDSSDTTSNVNGGAAGSGKGGVRGAIFTTTVDGTVVNENHFATKPDVYLDGGPGNNAPSHAAALAAGDYYFQVTDPSGKDLLSSDHISCRRIRVSADGVIVEAYAGTTYIRTGNTWTASACSHATGVDADHAALGAITVQLFPYDDTPNNGGVYKVWVTPVDKYAGDDDFVPTSASDQVNGEYWAKGVAHGFEPKFSKTDNFKVGPDAPPPPPSCGDGDVDAGEQCDDGNTMNGDGCSAGCTHEPAPCCGDGHLDAGEACDDGNTTSGDGCSATCTVEPPPPPPAPCCGDGHIDAGETCDDGNTISGDGCSAVCMTEPYCGNGHVDANEVCDDGNTVDGDGCSSNCVEESGCPEHC
ncbi:MAG: DUF4215 domain-containing protein [Myxococcota bacterium]|nr:DUF4215 domain-containing protein [Myxococcota bacterium]